MDWTWNGYDVVLLPIPNRSFTSSVTLKAEFAAFLACKNAVQTILGDIVFLAVNDAIP
jgi:hypothetical protein